MASAEQGKFYQYQEKQTFDLSYDDPDYSTKEAAYIKNVDHTKNQKYRTYFAELKNKYGNTQTSKALQGSCSYYDYFMKKQ